VGDGLQSLADFAQNLFGLGLGFGLRRGDFGRLNLIPVDGTSDRCLESRPGHLHEAEFHFHLSRDNLAAFEIVRGIPPERQRLFLFRFLLNIIVWFRPAKSDAADRQMHMGMGFISVCYRYPLVTF